MFWKKKNNNKGKVYQGSLVADATITDYLTDGLLVFDSNSKLSLVNPQAEKFFEVR